MEEAGIATDLFHNHYEEHWHHQNDELPANHQRYPLVQYKLHHRRAELVGIGVGAIALQLWLQTSGGSINIAGKAHPIKIRAFQPLEWQPKLLAQAVVYRMNKWLPLNPANYRTWQATPRLIHKAELLDKALWGHLFYFTECLEVNLPRDRLELFVSNIDRQTYKRCYGVQKMAFDITFTTNLNLPNEIGLGQGVSLGFGKLQRLPQLRS